MEGEESMEHFPIRFDDLRVKTKVVGCKLEVEMKTCLLHVC